MATGHYRSAAPLALLPARGTRFETAAGDRLELGRATATGGDGSRRTQSDAGEALWRALGVDGDGEIASGVVAASAGEDAAADLHQAVAVPCEAAHLSGLAVAALGVFAEAELAPGFLRGPVVPGVDAQTVVPVRGLTGRRPPDHHAGPAEP